jgi:hypothetical protein
MIENAFILTTMRLLEIQQEIIRILFMKNVTSKFTLDFNATNYGPVIEEMVHHGETFIMDQAITDNYILSEADIEEFIRDVFDDIAKEPDEATDPSAKSAYSLTGKLGTYTGDGFDLYISPIFITYNFI